MQSTVNGTVTTTAYIGNLEEVQTSGNTTQTTTYYTLGGKRIAAKVNSTLYYLGYDALGSQVAVLNTSGNVTGSQLYSPYGSSRYSNGTLPTSIGFTGQRADSVTGLDYYNARYYDPVVGQFMAADTVQGNGQGMDPYGYVGGNPETRTDPTGKRFCVDCGEDGSFSYGNGPSTPSQQQSGPPPDPTPPPQTQDPESFQQPSPNPGPTTSSDNSGRGGNSGSNGNKPQQNKPNNEGKQQNTGKTCEGFGCIQNWVEFVGGVAMVLSGLAILGAGIYALFQTAGSLSWILQLAKGAVQQAAAGVLGWIHGGLQFIKASLADNISSAALKTINILIDVISIVADVATIIASGADVLLKLGDNRTKNLFTQFRMLIGGYNRAQTNGNVETSVYTSKTNSLGSDFANSLGVLGMSGWDVYSLIKDINS